MVRYLISNWLLIDPLLAILFLSVIGSIAGLAGGLIFFVEKTWARKLTEVAVPFAAGILISVSLLHILPEAFQEAGKVVYLLVLLSLLGSFLFEQYLANLHHHEERENTLKKSSAALVIVGDTIHNFIDGVAIASAYLTDPVFGLVVTLATFLHETPHEIGDFGILIALGWTKTRTFWMNFLSALATFPGALLVFFWMRDAHEKVGWLLAISAGIFLYLGATDFLPTLSEKHTRSGKQDQSISNKKIWFLLFGVLIMYLLTFITPEH